MPMPLDEYLATVDKHLDLIEAAAEMCIRHAKALPMRPVYSTLAEHGMKRCEQTLRRSLIDVRRARTIYQRKQVGA